MTSFYSWRLMFLTFYGEARGDHHTHEHAHESPMVMVAPLGVLAVGAIFAGMVFYKPFFGSDASVDKFFGNMKVEEHALAEDPVSPLMLGAAHAAGEDGKEHKRAAQVPGQGAIYIAEDNHVLHEAHLVPKWVKLSPFLAMLAGFLLAYQFYIRRPDWPERLAENQRYLYNFLLNKWYVDEIYDFLFVKPAMWVGTFLWKKGDGATIDGGLNGLAIGIVPFFTRLAGRAQSGYIFTYAFAMVLGILVLVTWMTLAGGN